MLFVELKWSNSALQNATCMVYTLFSNVIHCIFPAMDKSKSKVKGKVAFFHVGTDVL